MRLAVIQLSPTPSPVVTFVILPAPIEPNNGTCRLVTPPPPAAPRGCRFVDLILLIKEEWGGGESSPNGHHLLCLPPPPPSPPRSDRTICCDWWWALWWPLWKTIGRVWDAGYPPRGVGLWMDATQWWWSEPVAGDFSNCLEVCCHGANNLAFQRV